jgi:hypothetical protein
MRARVLFRDSFEALEQSRFDPWLARLLQNVITQTEMVMPEYPL